MTECTPRYEVVMLIVGDPGANFQPPRQQDDTVEWLLPLLCWHQCLLPLQHHLGRHRLRLPLCAGHFHHHPARHPRKGGKWRGCEGSAPCWVHPMCCPPFLPLQQTLEQMCPQGRGLLMARAVEPPASPENKLQPSSCAGLHHPKFTGSPDLSLASSRLDLA